MGLLSAMAKKEAASPFWGGFIVIGCHHQRRIGTKSGRLFCVRNGFGRIVAAGACNEGNSAAGGFSTCRQNLLIFLLGKRGRFAHDYATTKASIPSAICQSISFL